MLSLDATDAHASVHRSPLVSIYKLFIEFCL